MIYKRKTYKSCSELPMYNFIKLVVYDDFNQVYKEQKTFLNRNIDLSDIISNIFDEYSQITNNKKGDYILSLIKEITFINNKLEIVQAAVNFLVDNYDKSLCDMLRRMGFPFKYEEFNLFEDLKNTIASAKRLIIKKKETEKDYKEAVGDEKKVTEADFYTLVGQISRYVSFHIDIKVITVLEFMKHVEAFTLENTKNGK